jgi:DNA polymerase III sliding clamp (beta) subunit (PCNA family)
MKKEKVNEEALKMASGGEILAYEPVTHKRISLEKGVEYDSAHILDFPKKLSGMAEFHLERNSENQDDFKRILFVSKALVRKSQGIIRTFKTFIHIEIEDDKKMAIATDGERLHGAVIACDLLPGNYLVKVTGSLIILKGPLEHEENFPNWRKIVPKNLNKKTVLNFESAYLSKKKIELAEMSHKMYKLIKTTDKLINLYYLKDLAKRCWSVYLDNDEAHNAPVVFKQDNEKEIFALIMPLKPEGFT